jgi:tetratricopeptide (TPR) repeat protein
MRKATVLEPNVARWTANVGFYYLHLGLDSLTELWLRKAMDLQPDYVFPYVWLAYRHAYRGEFDSAKAHIGRALAMRPDEFLALVAGGDVAMLGGSWEEAQGYYEKAVSIGGSTGDSGYKLAYVLHRLGRNAEAEALAAANLSAYAGNADRYPEGSQVPYYVAALYAWHADTAAANQWLERAISLGYRDYRWISADPQLEAIRNTARYGEIIGSLRVAWTEMRENALRQALQE